MVSIRSLEIPDIKLVEPPVFRDARGFLSETYNARAFADEGIDVAFVQDNHSLSVKSNTIRGLHFQVHPYAQAKLVRVSRGAILDVAVDLRRGSPTYGQHVTAVLSADNWRQIFLPVGFAHGMRTLEPNTEVLYKVSSHYAPGHDNGLLWNDPELGIDWGVGENDVEIADKDRGLPRLAELAPYFD